MPKFKILNEQALERTLRTAINRRFRKVFSKESAAKFLNEQAEILQREFANSEEFRNLKSQWVGEFGFTPEEVQKLDDVLKFLVPGGDNGITVTTIKTGANQLLMQLDWVDIEELKAHPEVQHQLTKLDASGSVVSVTDTVSWVEWLEDGATVKGYQFFRPGGRVQGRGALAKNFSRSGEGLMRKTGGIWRFQPTQVFERIARSYPTSNLRKGFGLLMQRADKE